MTHINFPSYKKCRAHGAWDPVLGSLTYQDLKSCGVSSVSLLLQRSKAQIPLHPNVRFCTLNAVLQAVLPGFLKSQIAGVIKKSPKCPNLSLRRPP